MPTCPLRLMMKPDLAVSDSIYVRCILDQCAWWRLEKGCAITRIADAVGFLASLQGVPDHG